jgi:hypothetical protein
VGDGGVTLRTEVVELPLQSPHLGPQYGVLLGYSELCGGDDVTEQGLGHDCSGLSSERVSPAPRKPVGASCGSPRVTGLDTQVNAKTASRPCLGDVAFVTLW